MTNDSLHPLQPCWDLALASVKADALDTALSLGLFAFLSEPATAEAVAKQAGMSLSNTRHLLHLLWSMAVLDRRPAQDGDGGEVLQRQPAESAEGGEWTYVLAPALAPFLTEGDPRYCGGALAYRLRALRAFGARLPALVKDGAPAAEHSEAGWAQAARSQIAQEQAAVTADAALACVQSLPDLAGPRRFLDLGGGPGKVAISLARAFPLWQGVVLDFPDTAEVAREGIRQAGLETRLAARGGDLARDDLGCGYDLVWCSSVLHFVDDVPRILGRIRTALAPGGYLVSAHAELPAEREAAARVLPYYLPLLTRGCRVWPEGALAEQMREMGFEDVVCSELASYPLAPARVVIGRKGLR